MCHSADVDGGQTLCPAPCQVCSRVCTTAWLGDREECPITMTRGTDDLEGWTVSREEGMAVRRDWSCLGHIQCSTVCTVLKQTHPSILTHSSNTYFRDAAPVLGTVFGLVQGFEGGRGGGLERGRRQDVGRDSTWG